MSGGVERRLAAIVAADVVGYSSLRRLSPSVMFRREL